MRDRLVRYLRLIYLIQSYPGIQAGRLAEECEVSERTIYRDLDLLSAVVPLANDGYGKGYHFTGQFALYPLDLTEQEMLALQTVAKWVESAHRPLPPGWKTAFEKVVAAHAKEKKVNETFVRRMEEIVQLGKPAYAPETPNVFPEILQAILHRRTVEALYHSQSRNETTLRRIDPYYLL
ncbi:MAG: HTH domain-containing protein, partial [Alicyclobacillaceae bacterium]|nr:HTH domain-containing protein [Alicyclobacillaceae bacterium]